MNLNLNQVLHPELVESFFHHLIRRLMKNEKFLEMMDSETLMQSLFLLFHIEQNERCEFANEINSYLIIFIEKKLANFSLSVLIQGQDSLNKSEDVVLEFQNFQRLFICLIGFIEEEIRVFKLALYFCDILTEIQRLDLLNEIRVRFLIFLLFFLNRCL